MLMPSAFMIGPPLLMVRLSAVRLGAVAMVMSLPLRVTLMLVPSRNCTVSPGATLLAVSPLACKFQPLAASAVVEARVLFRSPSASLTLVKFLSPTFRPAVTTPVSGLNVLSPPSELAVLLPTANSWPALTPSLLSADKVPGATFVSFLSPMLMPSAFMIGPPLLMVRLSAVRLGAVAMVMSLPLRVTLMLVPSRNCTVSPGATLLAVSPLACKFQPLPAVSLMLPNASLTLLNVWSPTFRPAMTLPVSGSNLLSPPSAFAVLSPTANSWLALTPSLLSADKVPGATFVSFLSLMLMPSAFMIGPPLLMVRLSAVRLGTVPIEIASPSLVMAILLPLASLTVAPGATLLAASSFNCRFQPLDASAVV